MKRFVGFTLGLLAACGTSAGVPRPSAKPNVLLVCVDDLKPVAGSYGGAAKTPHMDRLAARGVRFDKAYCNQAVCAPSRNALMTGLRPSTIGVYDLGTFFRKARPDAVTLAQQFRRHGYRAEALGKIFHVGHGNQEDPASWDVPHFKAEVVAYAKPVGPTREGALFSNQPAAGKPRGPAVENAEVPDTAYPDGVLAEEAVKRLRSKIPGEPFFMALGFVKPHLPFCAPKPYWDLYDRASFAVPGRRTPPDGAPAFAPTGWGELRQYQGIPEKGALSDELARELIHGYHAATSYMDAQLGRVLDALDETGLAANTIVVLWGDHGWHLGDHGMWCKHTNYEQAARIPLVIAGPGVAAGPTTALAESVDLYPTLCELAGLPVPDGLDGTSLAPVLRAPSSPGKESILHVYPRGGGRIGRAIRTSRHRLVEWKVPGAAAETADLELYDYEADPGETRNLAAEQPEVVVRLRALLAKHPEARPQAK